MSLLHGSIDHYHVIYFLQNTLPPHDSCRHQSVRMHYWILRGVFYTCYRADSRFAPSQWGTPILCNDVSHWLGTNLESISPRFAPSQWETPLLCNDVSHWLGTNLESISPRFAPSQWEMLLLCNDVSHWLGAILESEMLLLCNDVSHWLGEILESALCSKGCFIAFSGGSLCLYEAWSYRTQVYHVTDFEVVVTKNVVY